MTRILGIDPSLTGTGLAPLDTNDHLVIPVELITSSGTKDATLDDRRHRLLTIVETIVYKAVDHDSDLVVIEAPAFSRNNSGTWDRAGLWWLTITRLAEARMPVAQVPPTVRAKYATGKGNAAKGAVIDAVTRRYPHVKHGGNDNLCDALVLAAIGARLAGHPIDELPKAHLDALAKVPALPGTWAA